MDKYLGKSSVNNDHISYSRVYLIAMEMELFS